VTQPYEGGHPDHDATALAAHAACLILAEAGSTPPMLVEMAGYHLVDGVEVHGDFMCNPAAGAVESFPLSEVERNLKRRMFACHASQSNVLADLPLEAELFRRAPDYDFLRPPHPGQLGYERFGWDVDGSLWREKAEDALRRLGLLVVRNG
jgi:LmbE family N-acetylglucosaminyl deacetylase